MGSPQTAFKRNYGSWIDEKIPVYVVKMWRTLHNNDINQNPDPNI